jgi:hypothetical protein
MSPRTRSCANPISFWAFNASKVLLHTAAQRLRSKAFSEVNSLLESANVCIGVLRTCGVDEPIAIRFMDMIEPTYKSLTHLERSLLATQSHRNRSAEKMGIHNLLLDNPLVSSGQSNERSASWDLEGTPAGDNLITITEYLNDVLKDPYGRLQSKQEAEQPGPDPLLPESGIRFWFS